MKKQQSGFTLIELVIVIVILGLLAATALPRFADLSSDASEAALSGALGAVKSASSITHAQFLVSNTNPVILEGVDIDIVNGYPDAESIAVAAGATADFAPVVSGGTVTTFTTGNCSFTYTEAVSPAAPAISVITGTPC